MKNTISLSALAFSLLATANVFAGQVAASTTVNPVQCTKLSGDVAVMISANVEAAYSCGGTAIVVGACSKAGQTKTRSLNCTVTAPASGGTATVYSDPSCTGVGGATNVYNVTGPSVYTGNSAGGNVGQGPLVTGGGGTCGAAAVETKVFEISGANS